jgi:hypothetical protein
MVKHLITRHIGDLRGFSTDSIFTRPANVADVAINIQRAPDGTTQLRRGYQCQIAQIGGMGTGTFDDPATDLIQTVTIGLDGFLYNKVTKQIYFYYDGQITGSITGATQANPTQITSVGHGLITGAIIIIRNVGGMTNLNNKTFTITVTGVNTFTLNGSDSTLYPAYTSGGTWSIAFADQRYLTFTIFTDPRYLATNPGWSVGPWSFTPWGSPSGESITCNITVNRAAQISGLSGIITGATNANPCQITSVAHGLSTGAFVYLIDVGGMLQLNNNTYQITVTGANTFTLNGIDSTLFTPYTSGGTWEVELENINTVPVAVGHELAATDVIQFYSVNGVFNQRNVVSVTATSVTFDGDPVSVAAGFYINQFFDIPFRKGFDVSTPYTIATFIATITNGTTGIEGLQVAINGLSNFPAAFLQIIEPVIIDSNNVFTINYWYWQQVNYTIAPPFPGSANITNQNSPLFENASFAAYDDIIYIANGFDYPQKYDGQTVYRAGMPLGVRPLETDNTVAAIQPFVMGNVYEYAITYEQIDALGHIIEGEISPVQQHTVVAATAAINVIVTNLLSTPGNNWNTDGALAVGGVATVYGPDINNFYYDLVSLTPGFTLKIGDSAYYLDTQAAQINGNQGPTQTITVFAGHAIVVGDTVYFASSTPSEIVRQVTAVTATTITISGDPVTVVGNTYIADYKVSLVFGDVAIVSGNQSNVNTITVAVGYTIQSGDVVDFIDAAGRLQRRNVTAIGAGTITVDGIPVSVSDLALIYSENQRSNAVNLQRLNTAGASLGTGAPISNNLRINIYRTKQGQSFGVNGELFLVASIPNNSLAGTQTYVDMIADAELGLQFPDPDRAPNPPPISKYLKAFGNQIFYAGGQSGNSTNSDNVFFSEGNEPEAVPLASNFFLVPNVDDDVTGIGVSGSTLVTTKNHSLWAATGNFLSGQIDVVQIAPGTNIGCAAHASIASVGTLMYFLHTNGVYAITENQLFPTDQFGNPVPLSTPIDVLFRETPYLPQYRYVFKRAVACNYTKDNQYLLFLPCEDSQSTIRTANINSVILCYDYQGKNWYEWYNMNAAGGIFVIDDDLYFQERRFSSVNGNTANLYKQHRFYRLVDHADHAGAQLCEWRSSWEDLGQPEVRKKFCRCILLMDRLSDLLQYNNPQMNFSSYVNRIPNLQNTMAEITQVDNIRNSSWAFSPWGWNYWSGYQDSFVTINLKGGTVAKSMQVGFTIEGINMDIRLSGFQLEVIPENRRTVVR